MERTYSDFREMLDTENLDIVNIPTRTDLHAPLTIGVLEHRAPKAVIVEKPDGDEPDRRGPDAGAGGGRMGRGWRFITRCGRRRRSTWRTG